MAFTFNKTAQGNIEVFENGGRIATATPQIAAQQYGYNASVTSPVAPQATQTPQPATSPAKDFLMASSEKGLQTTLSNQQQIQKIQQGIAEAQKTATLAQQQKVADIKVGEPLAFGQAPGQGGTAIPLMDISGSSITASMINQINQASQEGISDIDKLGAIKAKETEALTALQQAQAANDRGDPVGLNTYVKQYQEQKKQYNESIAQYLKDVQGLRTERAKFAIPGVREQEVSRQLNELRTNQKKFELELEESKFSEFEGAGTIGFARGRVAEKEIRASFKRREMALQEQNLLLKLGLQQELRGFQLKSVEQQLSDFKDDFSLQQKVQEKLNIMEEDILEKASALRKEDQKTLNDILKNLEGTAYEDLSSEGAKSLNALIRSAGMTQNAGLIKEALKTQKARVVFEEGIKVGKETRAEEMAGRAESRLTLAEEAGRRAEIRLTLAEEAAQRAEQKVSGRNLSDEEFRIAVKNAQKQGLNKQDILNQIEIDTGIANKNRGRLIVSELIPEKEIEEIKKPFFQRLFGG